MKRSRITLSICLAGMAGVLLVPFSARAAAPARELPEPTGKLRVGRVAYYWTDDSRGDELSAGGPLKRSIRVDAWYPADATGTTRPAEYCPSLAALRKSLGAEAFLISSVQAHSLDSPPMATGVARYPLLMFSPGMGMNGFQYASFAEELVSHGYVVVTVDHPYQSRAIAYDGGRVIVAAQPKPAEMADPERAFAGYQQRVAERVADLRFALDQIARLNADDRDHGFAGRFDLDRVGVFGHSIGGVAAPATCQADSRFKAAVNLDGHARSLPMLLDADGRGCRQPFMEITDGNPRPTDAELAKRKFSREQFDEQMTAAQRKVDDAMRTISAGSFRVTIPGIRHGSFSDQAIWDTGPLEQRVHRIQIVRDYLRAFFDKHLLDRRGTLLDAEHSPYEEVTIVRFPSAT